MSPERPDNTPPKMPNILDVAFLIGGSVVIFILLSQTSVKTAAAGAATFLIGALAGILYQMHQAFKRNR